MAQCANSTIGVPRDSAQEPQGAGPESRLLATTTWIHSPGSRGPPPWIAGSATLDRGVRRPGSRDPRSAIRDPRALDPRNSRPQAALQPALRIQPQSASKPDGRFIDSSPRQAGSPFGRPRARLGSYHHKVKASSGNNWGVRAPGPIAAHSGACFGASKGC